MCFVCLECAADEIACSAAVHSFLFAQATATVSDFCLVALPAASYTSSRVSLLHGTHQKQDVSSRIYGTALGAAQRVMLSSVQKLKKEALVIHQRVPAALTMCLAPRKCLVEHEQKQTQDNSRLKWQSMSGLVSNPAQQGLCRVVEQI
eukprot:1160183-Pelagomonas_calceolata.AAC.2